MIIKSVTIDGFRSVSHKRRLTVSTHAGLTRVMGDNEKRPHLGANGVGKTSLFDAIAWCLYGKTAAGTRGPSLVNRDKSKALEIELDLRVGGRGIVVRRTHSPNSLSIRDGDEWRAASDEEVVDLVGIEHEQFCSCVIVPQIGRLFVDLPPASKLDVLTSLLSIGVWKEAAKLATRRSGEVQAALHEQSRKQAAVGGARESAIAAVARTQQRLARAVEEAESGAVSLRDTEQLHERLSGVVRQAEQKAETAALALNEATEAVKNLNSKVEQAASAQARRSRDVEQAEKTLSSLKAQLRAVDAKRCPQCGQVVDNASAKKLKAEVTGEISKHELAVEAARQDVKQATREQERLLQSKSKLRSRAKRRQDDVHAAYASRDAAISELANADKALAVARATQFDVAEFEQASYDSLRELASLTRHAAKLQEERETTERRLEQLEWWKVNFKKLRFWLIEQAVRRYEMEVNNALSELGMPAVQSRCEVKPASSGKAPTLDITLHAEGGLEVPLSSWSGGEMQRIRLAMQVALAVLVAEARGFWCNIEVWDEPTTHLSSAGIDDLITYLGERAASTGKRVFLIDHRALENGAFDETLHVRLTKKHGTRFSLT